MREFILLRCYEFDISMMAMSASVITRYYVIDDVDMRDGAADDDIFALFWYC